MVTVRLWWAETQDEDFLLAFRDVVVSVFGFGGNRIFEMDTTNFVWCRGGTRGHLTSCRILHPCRIAIYSAADTSNPASRVNITTAATKDAVLPLNSATEYCDLPWKI